MKSKRFPDATASQLDAELDRLADAGLSELGFQEPELERLAKLTWRINGIKKETAAVIPAHVYQRVEIVKGVADFVGDSYKLAKDCSAINAKRIVFCGVRFMAETAKILNPDKEVLLPAKEAGCSLADAITAKDLRALKARHPGVPVVSYINTTAAVKAESDVIVTSANAKRILAWMYERHHKVIFVPDAYMARNLASELGKEIGRDMVVWDGKCIVHENFDAGAVSLYRRMYPGVEILAHAECSPALVQSVDFVGGTGDMMKRVKESKAPAFMLVTECGLGDYARTVLPEKKFIPMCRLCPHMRATELGRILSALENPQPSQLVEVPPAIAAAARRSIERMFEIAEDTAKA